MAEVSTRGKAVVLLAAVAVTFVLGSYIPVLGFMPWPTDQHSQEQLLRFNIFAAGFTAWSTSWMLFQIFELIKNLFSSKTHTAVPIANALNVRVLLLTLLLSGFMWIGLLQSFTQFVITTELTTSQSLIGLTTGLTGTALLFFLARCLDHICPGYGFWGLLALAGLFGFAVSLPTGVEFLTSGAVSPNRLVIAALLFIVSICAAVFLMASNRTQSTVTPHHIFAVLVLAAAVSPWLNPQIFFLFESILPQLDEMLPAFAKGQALQGLMVLAAVILTPIFLFLISPKTYWNARFWLSCLSIATLYVTNELVIQIGGLPWPQLPVLTLAVLAWCAQHLYEGIPAPTSSREDDDTAFDGEFRRGWRN